MFHLVLDLEMCRVPKHYRSKAYKYANEIIQIGAVLLDEEFEIIGKLNQLIYNFPLQINNIGLSKLFTERRIGCGRECLVGGYCDRCFSMTRLAEKITPKLVEDLKKKVKKNNETN